MTMKQNEKLVDALLRNMDYISNTLVKEKYCSPDNVMDIVHDTYLRIKKANAITCRFDSERKTANYIIQIAKHVVADERRKKSIEVDYVDLAEDKRLRKMKNSTFFNHSDVWCHILRAAKEILKERQFMLFQDLFVYNKSQIAVSEVTGIPSGTIKSDKSQMLFALKNNDKFKTILKNLY